MLRNSTPYIEQALVRNAQARRTVIMTNVNNAHWAVVNACKEYGSIDYMHPFPIDKNSEAVRGVTETAQDIYMQLNIAGLCLFLAHSAYYSCCVWSVRENLRADNSRSMH